MTARLTITYGMDADAYLVACAVNRALEGAGARVMVEEAGDDTEIFIARHNQPLTEAVRFEPGQQLVVTYDDGWRIEDAPGLTPVLPVKRTPEGWSAEYGFEIHDPDGWRHRDAPAWDEPITLAEFYKRAAESTIRGILGAGTMAAWDRLTADVKAAAA